MLRLVSNPGSPQAWEIPLKPGANSIGRGPDNDFTLDAPSISSVHCRILVGSGSVRVQDLGSTNGTFVNDQPVQEAGVLPGQVIRLGEVELLLQTGSSATGVEGVEERGASAECRETVSSPLTPSPALPEPEPDKPVFCKNHFRNLARYRCPKCQRCFCDLCVNTRGTAGGGSKFCKVCGSECATMAIRPLKRPIEFFTEVPRAFKYPFAGDGLFLLAGGTMFFGFLDLANYVARHAFAFGLRTMMMRVVVFTFILGTGYLFSYLKSIIACTAEGEEQMPDWPELSQWKEDIVSPMFQFLILSLLSFGPALALYIWSDGDYPWLVWLAGLLGCFLFPMAFLGVAMFDSLAALHPLFVLGSIARIPREYSVTALVFTGIVGLRWLCETELAVLLRIPLVPALIADLLCIGLLIIEARILGLLFLSCKPLLGWFRK